MTEQGRKEFEIVFEAKGTAAGKMRSDVALTWVRPNGNDETFHLSTDEGPLLGGENTAPPPLAFFATALVGCLMTQIRAFSKSMKISIRDVNVDATFRWCARQVGGAPYEAQPKAISVEIDIDSDATEGDLLRLISAAKKGCFVEQTISRSVRISHRLKRPGGWTSL